MKKYEYTWKDVYLGDELQQKINHMGLEGWEMCSCINFSDWTRFFFKKELIASITEGKE